MRQPTAALAAATQRDFSSQVGSIPPILAFWPTLPHKEPGGLRHGFRGGAQQDGRRAGAPQMMSPICGLSPPRWSFRRGLRGGHEQRTVGPAPRQQAQLRDVRTGRLRRAARWPGHRAHLQGTGVPPDRPWMWTITGVVIMPALPSHGFCASLDEAEAQFAKTWRAARENR